MRRTACRLVLAVCAVCIAAPVAAENAAVAVEEVRHVDAVPPGPSVEERLHEIRRRIQAALDYPSLARWRDLQGATVVRFEIGSDGLAREVEVVRSSGEHLLDLAAARAVEEAGVLPWVYGLLEVPVSFALEEH